MELVIDTLNDFCLASRLKVSYEKSRVRCSASISRQQRDMFSNLAFIRFVDDLGMCLGFLLVRGRVRKHIYNLSLTRFLERWQLGRGYF